MQARIRTLEGFPVACTLPRPVGDGQGLQPVRRSLFVRVTAEDGTFGWGEGGPPVPGSYVLRTSVADAVQGMDAIASDLVHERAARLGIPRSLLGGLDIAVWDLKGKVLGQSIAGLLGGARRERVPAYASLHNYSESVDCGDELAELIRSAQMSGFRALKLKIGGRSLAEDERYLRLAREVAGPDFGLMADANQCYELAQATRMGRVLEELSYRWFEEPLARTDVPGYAALRAKLDIAIAGGEGAQSGADLQVLLQDRAVDITQPDVAGVGGFSEARYLARTAALWGAAPTWHVWNAPLVQVASLHLLANQAPWRRWSMGPEAAPVEVTTMPSPMREALVPNAPTIGTDGTIGVPSGPGLGVEVDMDALKTFAMEV
ncbi:MAG: mandelate racemase/muconate lactonizing enzyme family protein [Chloroflexota bacterium]|nr:mandelate racemase/muconate lactonizing enzyme family protein [Chloroflexota bacterium]